MQMKSESSKLCASFGDRSLQLNREAETKGPSFVLEVTAKLKLIQGMGIFCCNIIQASSNAFNPAYANVSTPEV